MAQTFAEELIQARTEMKMTQEELANRLNVSRPVISHWERGRNVPDLDMIRRISRELNHNFFTGEPILQPAEEAAAPQVSAEPIEPAMPQVSAEPIEPAMPQVSAEPIEPAAPQISAEQIVPTAPQEKKNRLPLIICLCVLAAVLIAGIVLLLWPKSETVSPTVEDDIHGAYISIWRPEVAYLEYDEEFYGNYGWNIYFTLVNVGDVPFYPERATIEFYKMETVDYVYEYTREDLLSLLGAEKMVKGGDRLPLYFGTNHLTYTRVDCTIYGTDEDGNALSFTEAVPLSQQMNPRKSGPEE